MKKHLREKRDKAIRTWYLDNKMAQFPLSDSDLLREINCVFSSPIPVTTFYRIIKDEVSNDAQGKYNPGTGQGQRKTRKK